MTDDTKAEATEVATPLHFALLPVDDATREHSDSALPIEMISAGADALEACREDLDNYVAGVTPDWDFGMTAVRVFRAMTEAGLPVAAGAQAQSKAANILALSILEEWAKPQTMKLHAGEMTAGEVRTVQAVLKGIAAAIQMAQPRTSAIDEAVLAERTACARIARAQGEKLTPHTKTDRAYREACSHIETQISGRTETEATATERRLLEHALQLNPYGIGTKCATAEDIVVAKAMVGKNWMRETNDGRFITDAGRRAIGI